MLLVLDFWLASARFCREAHNIVVEIPLVVNALSNLTQAFTGTGCLASERTDAKTIA